MWVSLQKKRQGETFKFRSHFLFNCLKESSLEGTVHLIPKATTYCFVMQRFVLANKANYKNFIWLRANICCKIQISNAVSVQGAVFRALFPKGSIRFLRLNFETLTVMVRPLVRKLWEMFMNPKNKIDDRNSSLIEHSIGFIYFLSKLNLV